MRVHSEATGPFISFFMEVEAAMEHKGKGLGTHGEDAPHERRFPACEFVLFVPPVPAA